MTRSGVSATRLMEESESRIANVRRQDWSPEWQIVDKLFDNPKTYMRWEAEHFRLMRFIAEDMQLDSELFKLRRICFGLIHSKALFGYLRENNVTGADRIAIFRTFYGTLDYSNAVIAEHGRFLRATWSLVCADHIDATLLSDPAFVELLPEYEAHYASYVSVYFGRIIAQSRGTDYAAESLIDCMKFSTAKMREKMLAMVPRRRATDAEGPIAGERRSDRRQRERAQHDRRH